MASIQSLGIGSGLLTTELVEDIIAAEREATDLRLEAKKAEFEAKISAFGTVQASVDAFRSAASAISTSSGLLTNATTSSDEDIVTATANSDAIPGIHDIEVLATASAQTLTSLRYDSPDEIVGDGLLDIRFGTTTLNAGVYDTFTENPERASVQINIDATNNTLTGIRDAINTADAGIIASVVDDGQGFVLALRSAQTGAAHSMEISVTEGATPGLSALAFNAGAATPGVNLTQSLAASDASLIIDGIGITRETNTISEVIPGLSFDVRAASEGKTISIGVNKDTEAISENVQAFVDAYNELKGLVDELTDFDADENVGALLTGDSTIRTLMSRVRNILSSPVTGASSSTIRAMIDIGISSNQNADFQLQFNSATFAEAINTDANAVIALLANETNASDEQISLVGFQSESVAGTYPVEITQAAAQGSLVGAATAGLVGGLVVDDDNDELTVTVDGVASGPILLAQGTYATPEDVALELESQINQDTSLRAAGSTVEVVWDGTAQTLILNSTRFGSASNIGIDGVDINTLAELGLDVISADGNVGADVEGTVNGIDGVGSGQFLSIPNGPTPARAGQYDGLDAAGLAAFPFTIDAANDTFSVSVDGTTSAPVQLTNGSFASAADIATEMQTQINADANLTGAGLSVSVAFDTINNRFEITSASTGLGSSAGISSASAGAVADLGLAVGLGTPGANAAEVADPAAGLQLRVQGAGVGDRGTVSLVRGIMDQINSFASRFTSFGGTLSNKLDSLREQVTDIDEEAVEFEERMDLLEDRLRLQFAAADALISTLNNTGRFLDQQLSNLPGYTRES